MLSIIAIAVSVMFSAAGVVAFVVIRRRERKNLRRISRTIFSLRDRTDQLVMEQLRCSMEALIKALAPKMGEAVKGHLPAILAQLRTEQRRSLAKMARWLRLEEGRFEAQSTIRIASMEKGLAGVAGATSRIGSWFKDHFPHLPWGHKNGNGQLPEPGPADT